MEHSSKQNTHCETEKKPYAEIAYGSNEIRLTGIQLIIAAGIIFTVFLFTPPVWRYLERFSPGPDYRIPYALSSDYWMFDRYARYIHGKKKIIVLGDSIIWGQYVRPQETLSHYLNEQCGRHLFVNMGVDGTHPAALNGLVTYFGKALTHERILLNYNLLWMCNRKRDLQDPKSKRFNHPRLTPQFIDKVPAYKADFSERTGIVIEREFPYLLWVSHIRTTWFQSSDIPAWTLEHPYANPFRQIHLTLPQPSEALRHTTDSWDKRGIRPQNYPWIEPEKSYQWRQFLKLVAVLQHRGNTITVLIAPFNEYILTPESRKRYQKIREAIITDLKRHHIAYYAADLLPSDTYADASHPLAAGYALLARQLLEHRIIPLQSP